MTMLDTTQPTHALYARIKQAIVQRIEAGDWTAGTRVPSENELASKLAVSRMTVNRALRELTLEGRLVRVAGVGTFVAERMPTAEFLELRNIADDVAARGHRYSARVYSLKEIEADDAAAMLLQLRPRVPVFRSVIVHFEDETPLQLEDRLVNPAKAHGYLEQDFTRTTPNLYLTAAAPADEVEHRVEAVIPAGEVRRRLAMTPGEACLLLHRRTWSGGQVVSSARLFHPGARYSLGARFWTTSPRIFPGQEQEVKQ
ncbi:histidine utilization repressor [Rhodospirillaceae bacterium SYSU D60014]|uniref:histidine utilization repressor n=1 Tax=Virgifigura deserti TaxID=2268457 RepID=UPI000E674992